MHQGGAQALKPGADRQGQRRQASRQQYKIVLSRSEGAFWVLWTHGNIRAREGAVDSSLRRVPVMGPSRPGGLTVTWFE
jgi:hypothetical protein